MAQRELADEAGVGRPAVQRIESGEPVNVITLLRVLRALGLLDMLDRLVPEPLPSPMQLLALQGKRRQRASAPGHGASRATKTTKLLRGSGATPGARTNSSPSAWCMGIGATRLRQRPLGRAGLRSESGVAVPHLHRPEGARNLHRHVRLRVSPGASFASFACGASAGL
jgi:transcriptional regulator with XRE-family HTH domain